MNIPIGDFVITSDPNCFILNERKVKGEDSKNPGEEYIKPFAFYTDFSHILKGVLKHTLLRSDCRTLVDVMDTLRCIHQDIEGALSRYEKVADTILEQNRTYQLLRAIKAQNKDILAWMQEHK